MTPTRAALGMMHDKSAQCNDNKPEIMQKCDGAAQEMGAADVTFIFSCSMSNNAVIEMYSQNKTVVISAHLFDHALGNPNWRQRT